MAEVDSWLSHAITGALAAIPGVGAWYLEWSKNRTVERRSAVDELSAVVEVLQKQVDRMEHEIETLRSRAETAEDQLRAQRVETRSARDEIHAMRNWMQKNGYSMPPPFGVPPESAHA
jgi:outer membrane murein-binding lipoprotein Lpp